MEASGRVHGRGRQGQALAEFALVIPVFLLVLFAILDFGLLGFSRTTLFNATREGARAAIVQIDNPQSIPAFVASAMQANSTGLDWRPGTTITITTTCVAASGHPACDFVAGGAADPQPGDMVNVTATYIYRSLFARFLGVNVPVSTTVQMPIE